MTRTRPPELVAFVVPALAVVLLLVLAVGYDGRKHLDLASWAEPRDTWTAELMPGADWATDDLCDEELPCIQAVESDTVTMYRFAERSEAVAMADRLGDGAYLTGWIVLHFVPGGLTSAERYDLEYSVGCNNTWESEDGRDC